MKYQLLHPDRLPPILLLNGHKKYFLVKYTALMLMVAIPIALPAIVAPGFILETLFRPEYSAAAPTLRVMGVYLFVVSIDIVATQYVLSDRMEKSYLLSVLISGLISFVLCLYLIPVSGSVGAALALLISHSVLVIFYWIRIGYSLKGT